MTFYIKTQTNLLILSFNARLYTYFHLYAVLTKPIEIIFPAIMFTLVVIILARDAHTPRCDVAAVLYTTIVFRIAAIKTRVVNIWVAGNHDDQLSKNKD